ncbi:MAG: hypothetical protein M1821_008947, partial [Bathelium mastoideum]
TYKGYGDLIIDRDGDDEDELIIDSYGDDDDDLLVDREAPELTFDLLKKAVSVGKAAAEWERLYIIQTWNGADAPNRRSLSPIERARFYKAIYRIWLFHAAFHNKGPGSNLNTSGTFIDRITFLSQFSAAELAQTFRVFLFLRGHVEKNICPSFATVKQQVQQRDPNYQESHGGASGPANDPAYSGNEAHFHYHLTPGMSPSSRSRGYGFNDGVGVLNHGGFDRYRPTSTYDPFDNHWGDDFMYERRVDAVLKLGPRQLLYLLNNVPRKQDAMRRISTWIMNRCSVSADGDLGIEALPWEGAGEFLWDLFVREKQVLEDTLCYVVDSKGYPHPTLVEDGRILF